MIAAGAWSLPVRHLASNVATNCATTTCRLDPVLPRGILLSSGRHTGLAVRDAPTNLSYKAAAGVKLRASHLAAANSRRRLAALFRTGSTALSPRGKLQMQQRFIQV